MLYHFLHNLEASFSASPLLGLLASFLAGIIVSFSPCILPLVPITLSIVGATSVSSRRKGFAVSLVFVLGVATTYTILGILAAVFYVFIDKFFMNPFVYGFLSLFFTVMALSALGVVKFNFFALNHNYKHKENLFSIFIFGAISGLAITPCNFPVLGSILTLISLRKDIFYNALALFLFALGSGLILVILGTFSSFIVKLPKRSLWLIIINRLLGIVMLFVGIYFFLKLISML
ncbi:MAG: cytochrome c biogenesis protein CcdA [Candidatus Omnitrophota bacterium]